MERATREKPERAKRTAREERSKESPTAAHPTYVYVYMKFITYKILCYSSLYDYTLDRILACGSSLRFSIDNVVDQECTHKTVGCFLIGHLHGREESVQKRNERKEDIIYIYIYIYRTQNKSKGSILQ